MIILKKHDSLNNQPLKLSRKDRVYAKLQELTCSIPIGEKNNTNIGIETSFIAEQLEIGRNNASKELNNLVREGKAVKIQGRPVLYLDKDFLVQNQIIKDDV